MNLQKGQTVKQDLETFLNHGKSRGNAATTKLSPTLDEFYFFLDILKMDLWNRKGLAWIRG